MSFYIEGNKSDFKIVIPKNAVAAEEQAAQELRSYTWICTSGGARLEVIDDTKASLFDGCRYFSVGRTSLLRDAKLNTDYSKLKGDGFVIECVNGCVITDAARPRGFMYAVYEFVERFMGVRFFAPDYTHIPPVSDVPLPNEKITCVPAFLKRAYLSAPVFGYGAWLNEPYVAHSRTVHNWFPISSQYGGEPINCYGRLGGTHNAHMYVPAEKYGTRESTGYKGEFARDHDPHPEFYYTVPGHEPVWEGHCYGPAIDYTNGITEDGELDGRMYVSVAKAVIEELKKDIVSHPEVDYFTVDQEDCMDPLIPQTEQVKKYTAAGVQIRFFNVVIKELRKWADAELGGRKFYINFFAYNQTKDAPVKKSGGKYVPVHPSVVPHPDLCIRLAYSGVLYYPYDDARQPEDIREMGVKWMSIHNRFWFWGYDAVYTDYIAYNASLTQAYGTVRFLSRLGADYVHIEASEGAVNDWQAQLKSYIWSKLLWNPEQDVSLLKDEYLDGYYGKAADCVRRMIDLFERRYAEIYAALPVGDMRYDPYRPVDDVPGNISAELLLEARKLIEEGERIIKTDGMYAEYKEQYLVRLARVKATPVWMYLKHFWEFCPNAKPKDRERLVDEFADLVRYAGIRQSREDRHVLDWLKEAYGYNYGIK